MHCSALVTELVLDDVDRIIATLAAETIRKVNLLILAYRWNLRFRLLVPRQDHHLIPMAALATPAEHLLVLDTTHD